jgi:hypothetical protein
MKPNTQQIVYSFKILEAHSQEALVKLIESRCVFPETAVQIYPQDEIIVAAAYRISAESIRYADPSIINKLGLKGVIDEKEVIRIFSIEKPSETMLMEKEKKFEALLLQKNWDEAKKLTSGFWFEKSPYLTEETISERIADQLDKETSWNELLQFLTKDTRQKEYFDLHGPHPKLKETYDLEKLVRMMMQYADFEIELQGQDEFIVFTQRGWFSERKISFNWTKIIHKANFRDIVLNQSDLKLFESYWAIYESKTGAPLGKSKGQYMPSSLSFAEKQVLHTYTKGAYSQMNKLMREKPKITGQSKQDFRSTLIHCVLCANALRKGSDFLLPPVHCSERGLDFDKNMIKSCIKSFANNEVIYFDGFLSSTYSSRVDAPITGIYATKSIQLYLSNLRGLDVSPVALFENEHEYLILPTQIRLQRYEMTPNKYGSSCKSHYIYASLVDIAAVENDFIPIVMVDQHPILKEVGADDLVPLIDSGEISPHVAVSHFLNCDPVILAAYRKDPTILGYLSVPKVLDFVESREVSLDDVRKIFPNNPAVMKKNWDIHYNELLAFFNQTFVRNGAYLKLFSNRFIVGLSRMSEKDSIQAIQEKINELELLPGTDFDWERFLSLGHTHCYSESFIKSLRICLENRFSPEKSVLPVPR